MNKEIPILYVKDFSETPTGRYFKDGSHSGENFIKDKLEPMFKVSDKFIVNLDGVYGYPSSFREEAFGGLARMHGSKAVLDKITFVCEDEPAIIKIIEQEIKDVDNNK